MQPAYDDTLLLTAQEALKAKETIMAKSNENTEVFQSYHGGEALSVTRRDGVITLVTRWSTRKGEPGTQRLNGIPAQGIFLGDTGK